MVAPNAPVAVLFMTHFVSEPIIVEYRKLRREVPSGHDVVLLYNTTERLPGVPPADTDVFRFDERSLRGLAYRRKSTRINSHNIDLFVLNFWRNRPQYEFYWVIEYDVRFSGDWRLVFEAFADSAVDLLSTTVYRYPFNPDWANWPTLKPPPGVELAAQDKIASFLPFYRISNRGLTVVDQGYRDGWAGHCECTVPTLLARNGLSIEDIGGDGEFVQPGNVNRFYRNTPKVRTHGPGTLVFRPIQRLVGDEPNQLWHPVKCAEGMATTRRQRVWRRARILWRTGLEAVGLD